MSRSAEDLEVVECNGCGGDVSVVEAVLINGHQFCSPQCWLHADVCPHGQLPRVCNVCELEADNARLKDRIHEAYEIYAGMEGFETKTALEGYLLRLIGEMARTLKPQEGQECHTITL